MEFLSGHAAREEAIIELFTATFSNSEGADEGGRIGELARDLMETTPPADLLVWSACDDGVLAGCIFLSRLSFAQEDRSVFILSPVAVRTDRQGKGIGQALIARGLDDLRHRGVDFVVTYGDPNYYVRTGFGRLSEDFARAPLRMSIPEGWLGQPLSEAGRRPFAGASRCVPALDRPELW